MYDAVAIFRANYVRRRIQPDIRSHNNNKGGRRRKFLSIAKDMWQDMHTGCKPHSDSFNLKMVTAIE